MSVIQSFKDTLGSTIKYHKHEDICGITIKCDSDKWTNIFEEWLPKFEEVGWLEDLNGICVVDEITESAAVAKYTARNTIVFERGAAKDGFHHSMKYILVHEFIHHAHFTLNEFENYEEPVEYEDEICDEINCYASSNVGEAVAEIGAHIVFDKELPHWLHEYYKQNDGPEGVYDIG